MTATVEQLWHGTASRYHRGVCDDCGNKAQVARQERSPKFQCLNCFTKNPTGSATLRSLVRLRREGATA